MENIRKIIQQFPTISLEQMDQVALLNRFDSKYELPVDKLCAVLEAVKNDYFILKINENLIQKYRTTYFDTPNNSFYISHHNGKLNRIKIRKREYVDSGIGFLEIKKKNNKGKTRKLRLKTYNYEHQLTNEELNFLRHNTDREIKLSNQSLSAKSRNIFQRITLVNKNLSERCTLDLNLNFYSEKEKVSINNMAIIELKQGTLNMKTPLSKELKRIRIYSKGFSKYCVGRAFLEPDLKRNIFKAKMLHLKKAYKENIVFSEINMESLTKKEKQKDGTINRYVGQRTAQVV